MSAIPSLSSIGFLRAGYPFSVSHASLLFQDLQGMGSFPFSLSSFISSIVSHGWDHSLYIYRKQERGSLLHCYHVFTVHLQTHEIFT